MIGLICGVTLNAFQSASLLAHSLVGLVIGVMVLIVPFAFGWIGAGDVKFFGVVGSLLGVSWLPLVFFYSALVAGLIALSYLAAGTVRSTLFRQSWLDLKVAVLSMGQVFLSPCRNGAVNKADRFHGESPSQLERLSLTISIRPAAGRGSRDDAQGSLPQYFK